MATIFHLALASDWAAAQEAGAYTTSTLGMTLDEVGFIHASRAEQWTATRERFYADVAEPLVLLQIDTDLLDVPVIEEQGHPGSPETFPHIYGRLLPSAVVRATPLPPLRSSGPDSGSDADGGTAEQQTTRPATEQTPPDDFTKAFFTGVATNAALLLGVMALSVLGIVVGQAIDDRVAPGLGGVLGLVLGAFVARRIYVARVAV
ncbi:DUF952 domain-containing protein [Nocardioides sp.]|uniref:DUF952 domain-containing protein n=1 Tax=Nocardioides sp. TaxID=35761 RepID=UPI003517AA7A